MQEMFTKDTPITYYERKILELRKEGKTEDADRLAYLIAAIKYRLGEVVAP